MACDTTLGYFRLKDVTICECVDGMLVDNGFVLLDTDDLAGEITNERWHIRFSDVTVLMALNFCKSPTGQEVIANLCEKGVPREAMRVWSYTQLLAMEAAQKIVLQRAFGSMESSNGTWQNDLRSFAKEFGRITQTWSIFWNA